MSWSKFANNLFYGTLTAALLYCAGIILAHMGRARMELLDRREAAAAAGLSLVAPERAPRRLMRGDVLRVKSESAWVSTDDVVEAGGLWSATGVRYVAWDGVGPYDIKIRDGSLGANVVGCTHGGGSIHVSPELLKEHTREWRIGIVAHELGHAMGVGHVSAECFPIFQKQCGFAVMNDAAPLPRALTALDMRAWEERGEVGDLGLWNVGK